MLQFQMIMKNKTNQMVALLKRSIKIATKARKDTAYKIWYGHKLNILPRRGRHIQPLVTIQRSLKLLIGPGFEINSSKL